jgi:trehalose 6-phosphate phosphatase
MPTAPDNLDPDAIALFLDVDGTLLAIRDNPSDVTADRALIGTLEACFDRLGGALALISGRSVAEVDRIFAPAVFPVAGAHGSELRGSDGCVVSAGGEPLPQAVLESLEAFATAHEGLLLEHKRGGVSLHYRRAPALESECRRLVDELLAGLGDSFRLIAGKMVFEIAPSAHDKGAAIRQFLEAPPFEGRLPVFFGDDVTDEDGFRVVNELGGLSVRVGDIEHSEAQYRLAGVAAVQSWLRETLLDRAPRHVMETNALE